jgi:small-conductance mechanosensitive channel
MIFNFSSFFTYKFLLDCGFFIALFIILTLSLKALCKILSRPNFQNRVINYELCKKTAKPIYFLIYILFGIKIFGNFICITNIDQNSCIFFIERITIVQSIITIIFLTISLYIFITKFKYNYITINKNNKKIDPYIVDILSKVSLLLLFSISLMAIMQKIGIGFGALATFGGASGIIIGFATKDFFGNIAGLIYVYLDKPFILGDQIAIFNGSSQIADGIVEEIGIRMTIIRTVPQRTALYIPNLIFTTNIIENKSRRSHRIFEKKLKIYFNCDISSIDNIMNNLREKIRKLDFIDITNQDIILEIKDIDEQFIHLNIMIFFIKMDLKDFIENSNILTYIIFDELKRNDLCAISKEAWVTFNEKKLEQKT